MLFGNQVVTWVFVLGLGAILGSFLSVCIYRIPRHESLITPGSHCPNCQAPIRFYDNIPLASVTLLRGRCRLCRGRIPWTYPAVEALSILMVVLLYAKFGLTGEGLRGALLALALLALTFIDIAHHLLPDRITLPWIAVGLATVPLSSITLPGALLGGLLGGGILFVVALVSGGGMGGGDVKLAAMIGTFLGWQQTLLALFVGVLFGGLLGSVLLALGLKGRKDPVPFGPFLALGGVASLLWGESLLRWYLG